MGRVWVAWCVCLSARQSSEGGCRRWFRRIADRQTVSQSGQREAEEETASFGRSGDDDAGQSASSPSPSPSPVQRGLGGRRLRLLRVGLERVSEEEAGAGIRTRSLICQHTRTGERAALHVCTAAEAWTVACVAA